MRPQYPLLMLCGLTLSSCQRESADTARPQTELTCPVTFTHSVAADSAVESLFLSGDFNRWSEDADPLTELEPGLWSITVDLPPGPAVPGNLVGSNLGIHSECRTRRAGGQGVVSGRWKRPTGRGDGTQHHLT